jgi:hypothetical protein
MAVDERHYRVDELATLWRLSPETIRRLFREEPGVIKIGKGLGRYRRRRPYLTLSIPESVASRVKARISAPLRVA